MPCGTADMPSDFHSTPFAQDLLRRMLRRGGSGRTSPMLPRWQDGLHPQVVAEAERLVDEGTLPLHDYARALNSSQAFALNLFLPFRVFTARQKPATAARQNRPPFQSRSPTRSPDRQPQAHAAITATTKNPVGCHHPPGSSDAVVVVVGQAVGCRSDGPSMRSVVHRCRRRSSNAPTISLRPRNEYQSSYSRFVVKIVDFRL